MRAPRLLLLLGQSPFDPTSGAAQSMRQWAELLAQQGWEVRSLATRGCEVASTDPHRGLQAPDGSFGQNEASFARADVQLTRLVHGGLQHEILHSDPARPRDWERDVGSVYQAHLDRLLAVWAPDLLLTFGDDPGDRARRAKARTQGARVVFALHNLAYHTLPPDCDHFVAPSHFLAQRYRTRWPGTTIEVLPTVLMPDAVIADTHDPVFATFVNPEPSKGAALVARLAAMLGRERPDIPLLVVEGRAHAGQWLQTAFAAGEALKAYPNILFAPATPRVKELWAHCRILLMPSVVEEAAGRCALEAMANGAVPLVSDRGALPETVGDAGMVLPAAASPRASGDHAVRRWFDAITALVDDPPLHARMSARARARGGQHLPDALGESSSTTFLRWSRTTA